MLVTKLHIPSPTKNLVHRTELFDILKQGLEKKLILISAPAGFGKTTIISDWIAQNKIPAAWYSIDKRDNDPVEFLTYIVTSIQNIEKSIGKKLLQLLNAPHRPNTESILTMLINDILTIKKDFVLVFDDFHLINSKEILDAITFFIEYTPGHMHIAISTRSDPSLPLARLRSQNQLIELRASDLSFSAMHVSTFFNKRLKLGLSEKDIYSLQSKTEGWIAGLQLTALSMQGSANVSKFIQAFTGDNRYIMDYLIEEVINMQTEDVKNFLLKTSVLEEISGSLCDAVLTRDDSQLVLESLEKNNMFIIPLDNERNWYRYHHLFADLLKQRLYKSQKGKVNDLHNKASLWYEENGMQTFAIEHALEAKNYDKAMQLLNSIVERLWEHGQHAAIMNFGELLPDEIVKKNPEFCLFYSWILISSGHMKKAGEILEAAEILLTESINTIKDDDKSKELLGKISVAFTYLLSNSGNLEKTFHYCEQAHKYLTENKPLWFSWACFSYGVAFMHTGELEQSINAYRKALKFGKISGNLYLISTTVIRLAYSELHLGNFKLAYKTCKELVQLINEGGYEQMAKNEWSYSGLYSTMGYIQFMWNEPGEALQNSKTAYESSKKGKDITTQIFSSIIYGWVLLLFDDRMKSEKIIAELDELTNEHETPHFLTLMLYSWKMEVFISQKQYEKAYQLVKKLDLGADKEITFATELVNISFARFLISQYKLDEAEEILAQLHPKAESGKRIERLIEIKILYAILHKIKGNREKALGYLSESIVLAEKENLVMFFILESENIADLVQEIYKKQATTNSKVPGPFVKKIVLAIKNRDKHKNDSVNDTLSKREIEVLKLIAEDFSNQDIADKLFISLNTVKTHAKNIHLKLEVDSRTKAVVKAKELGLLKA